jgi:ElaB/YqjD/DUF883 family membrane-anchored ribosome-binding protein
MATNGAATTNALSVVRGELDETLTKLRAEIERRTADAAENAKALASAGIDTGRSTITANPLSSILVAALVGAGIGLLLTRQRSRNDWRDRAQRWTDSLAAHASADDARDLARSIRKSAGRAFDSGQSTLMSAAERVGSALASVDAKSSLSPFVDRAAGWLDQARTYMKQRQ